MEAGPAPGPAPGLVPGPAPVVPGAVAACDGCCEVEAGAMDFEMGNIWLGVATGALAAAGATVATVVIDGADGGAEVCADVDDDDDDGACWMGVGPGLVKMVCTTSCPTVADEAETVAKSLGRTILEATICGM